MAKIYEQKCPNCASAMRYDPFKGKLICDNCGSELEVDQKQVKSFDRSENQNDEEKSIISGFNYKDFLDNVYDENSKSLPIYVCQSCGAEIIASDEEFSLTCPYCQNNVVLTDKVTGKLKPDGIIPFKILPDSLPQAVRAFYKNKKFLPKSFFSQNKIGKVTGLYVPFWMFSGKAYGKVSYIGEKYKSSIRRGDYIDQYNDVYEKESDVSLEFKNLPVDASGKMNDELMDSIEPFNMDEMKSFDYGYLAGFAADRFDAPADSVAGRAERRVCNTLAKIAKKEACAGYSTGKYKGSNLKADMDAKYVLIPVYHFNVEYKGEKYKFAVNGQTGKVAGNLPYDDSKKIPYLMKRMLIIAAVIVAIFVAKYLLGW